MASMILLNESGDITIEWSDQYEKEMKELIKKKIAEGYTFFILKSFLGFQRKVKLVSAEDLSPGARLVLHDEDAVRLFQEGKIKAGSTEQRQFEVAKSSKDAGEIAKSDSLAVRPIVAG